MTEPVAGPDHGSGTGLRSDPGTGTGTHRAASDPGAAAFRPTTDAATGTGSHRAVADPGALSGAGLFRSGSPSAAPEGTGSHRAASGTGSFPPVAEDPAVPGPDPYRPASAHRASDDERTRAIPTVRDEQRYCPGTGWGSTAGAPCGVDPAGHACVALGVPAPSCGPPLRRCTP